MNDMRRFRMMTPFWYNGVMLSPILYLKGNSDLVHSWDIGFPGMNLSKSRYAEVEERTGLTASNIRAINERIQRHVDFTEGRR